MSEHKPEHTELVKRFFQWAYDNKLQPSIKAMPASRRNGPSWRISVKWGTRSSNISFDDREAVLMIRDFTKMIVLFDPNIPTFEASA